MRSVWISSKENNDGHDIVSCMLSLTSVEINNNAVLVLMSVDADVLMLRQVSSLAHLVYTKKY